jgi:hypothetical protein
MIQEKNGEVFMSTAKAAIFDEINAMPDNLDELEIIDSLYHRIRLKQSRESIEEYGTLSTDEVREYFRNKREKRQAVQ